MHDPEVFPHMHESRELEKLFPLLETPPPGDNVEDWEPLHADGLLDEFQVLGRRGGHAHESAPLRPLGS